MSLIRPIPDSSVLTPSANHYINSGGIDGQTKSNATISSYNDGTAFSPSVYRGGSILINVQGKSTLSCTVGVASCLYGISGDTLTELAAPSSSSTTLSNTDISSYDLLLYSGFNTQGNVSSTFTIN